MFTAKPQQRELRSPIFPFWVPLPSHSVPAHSRLGPAASPRGSHGCPAAVPRTTHLVRDKAVQHAPSAVPKGKGNA
jgi:hypothetical protein